LDSYLKDVSNDMFLVLYNLLFIQSFGLKYLVALYTKRREYLVFIFMYTGAFLLPSLIFLHTISLTHPCGNTNELNSTKARIYNIKYKLIGASQII
jgi:hypothetical protein